MHDVLVGAITMNGRVQEFLISRARKIERALGRRSWTRVHLAELTGYDERTIRNVLGAKPVRDQTIIDICQALGIEPDLEDSWRIAGHKGVPLRANGADLEHGRP
jgi:DNA-binding Xre family transcriptional regulator